MTEVWDQYREAISGGWRCISFDLLSTDDRKPLPKPHGDSPLGNTPLGRIFISRNGWLAAHLAQPDRLPSPQAAKPWSTASDGEVAHIARGLTMYCGYLKLYKDSQGHLYWQCNVEMSTDPNRLGGIQERGVTLSQENGKSYMILEPKQDMVLEV